MYQYSKRNFSDTPFGMFLCAILFAGLIFVIGWGIYTRKQMEADSINAMTGSNYSAEDMMLNGHKIIIIPK